MAALAVVDPHAPGCEQSTTTGCVCAACASASALATQNKAKTKKDRSVGRGDMRKSLKNEYKITLISKGQFSSCDQS